MAHLIVDEQHIFDQVKQRYEINQLDSMLNRVKLSLESQAPADWRFTQSPSARFFVIDFETQIKFLGFSYRNIGAELVKEIQTAIEDNQVERLDLTDLGRQYKQGLLEPGAKIWHDLRTAYPKTKGEIGEEKSIISGIKEQLRHTIPWQAKKLAARPNAIVQGENDLWVRQYLNWMDVNQPDKEYLLFEKLTPQGVDKAQKQIFSYTVNGDVKKAGGGFGCPHGQQQCLFQIKKPDDMVESYQTDSYWSLPTYVDRRLLDLEFRERQPEKAEGGPLTRDEVVELYFLRKIVHAAQAQFRK